MTIVIATAVRLLLQCHNGLVLKMALGPSPVVSANSPQGFLLAQAVSRPAELGAQTDRSKALHVALLDKTTEYLVPKALGEQST